MSAAETAATFPSLALPIEPLAPPQALMLAEEVAQRLGWQVHHLSAFGLMAHRPAADIIGPDTQLVVVLYANGIEVSTGPALGTVDNDAMLRRAAEDFGRAFAEELPGANQAALQRRFEQARPGFVPPERDVLRPNASSTVWDWLNLLRPRADYFVTPLLIVASLLVFVLMLFDGANIVSPSVEVLLRWGADFGPLTLGEGQWWRLLSNAFVHIGALHLLLNMYALLNIGLLLEPRVGPMRFGLAYLLAALGGSLGSLWWHDYTVSAGASGAIFGMYGVFLALLTTNVVEAEVRKPLLTSIGTFVAYNLMFGLAGNIDNAAHIGGLLTGLLVGYGYWTSLRTEVPAYRQHLLTAGLAAVLLAGAGLAYHRLAIPWTTYQATMQRVGKQEDMALEALRLPDGATRSRQLEALGPHGIDYWRQNLRLLQRLDSLRLPDGIKQHNQMLKQYNRLQLRSYQLIYRAVEENSEAYADSVASYSQQIQALIDDPKNKAK